MNGDSGTLHYTRPARSDDGLFSSLLNAYDLPRDRSGACLAIKIDETLGTTYGNTTIRHDNQKARVSYSSMTSRCSSRILHYTYEHFIDLMCLHQRIHTRGRVWRGLLVMICSRHLYPQSSICIYSVLPRLGVICQHTSPAQHKAPSSYFMFSRRSCYSIGRNERQKTSYPRLSFPLLPSASCTLYPFHFPRTCIPDEELYE